MLFRLFVDINMPSAWDAACPALKANVHLFKAQLRCPLLREAVPSTGPLQATWHFPPDRELSEVGRGRHRWAHHSVGWTDAGVDGRSTRRLPPRSPLAGRPQRCVFSPS